MNCLLLYDGDCGLCHQVVRWIIRHDASRVFRFTPLSGETARPFLDRWFTDGPVPDSVILVENPGLPGEKVHIRTNAVLVIAGKLDGLWRAVLLLQLVPRFLRDGVYRLLAANRQRLFPHPRCQWPSGADSATERFLP